MLRSTLKQDIGKRCHAARCQDVHFFRRRWREGRSGVRFHSNPPGRPQTFEVLHPMNPKPSPPIPSTHQLNSARKVDSTEYRNASSTPNGRCRKILPQTGFLVLHFLLTGNGEFTVNTQKSSKFGVWAKKLLAQHAQEKSVVNTKVLFRFGTFWADEGSYLCLCHSCAIYFLLTGNHDSRSYNSDDAIVI